MVIRLSEEEKSTIEKAADAAKEAGDRGGYSGWARKVLLREAKRVADAEQEKSKACGVE